jgi:hypothetical protein
MRKRAGRVAAVWIKEEREMRNALRHSRIRPGLVCPGAVFQNMSGLDETTSNFLFETFGSFCKVQSIEFPDPGIGILKIEILQPTIILLKS